jgi:hypothetical protein
MLAQIYDAVLVGDVGVGEARREQRGHLIDGLQNIFHLNEKTKDTTGQDSEKNVGFFTEAGVRVPVVSTPSCLSLLARIWA